MADGCAIDVFVRFSPIAEGFETGTLEITSDDPDEPMVTVTLTGSGVANCPGDFDNDGDVDDSDLQIFALDFGRTDCGIGCAADFEPDGDVDGSNFAIFTADFGRIDCP